MSETGLEQLDFGTLDGLFRFREEGPIWTAYLVALPPTAEIEAQLEHARDVAARQVDSSWWRLRVNHFEQQLERARARDVLAAARHQLGPAYEGCWCLGQGGRDQVGLGVVTGPHGLLATDNRTSFREFCGCPDGEAARQRRERILDELTTLGYERQAAQACEAARIPSKFRGVTIASWKVDQQAAGAPPSALKAITLEIEEWWERIRATPPSPGPRVLLLAGAHGEGKSVVACALLQLWLERGGRGLRLSALGLFDELRALWGQRTSTTGPSELSVIEVAKATPLLVLDDLGAEGLTERNDGWMIPILADILSHRENEQLPTIVTSNLTIEDLAAEYGERLVQRIGYSQVATVARFSGLPNLRGEPLA